jgi:hypothetical protein
MIIKNKGRCDLKYWRVPILFWFVFSLATDISYAAGMIYRVQQMKAMKQQQAQQQSRQYQEYQQEGGAAQSRQAPAAPPTYQQTVDQRNQAIAQAILAAHNQSVSGETVPFGNTAGSGAAQQQQAGTQAISAAPNQAMPNQGTGSADVVDLTDVWKKLDVKSTIWTALVDDQSKILTVSEYITRFQNEGVKITAPPAHYVTEIDQMVQQNPEMLKRPFGELLQMVAIIDYDFDNGVNKDDLARKLLGEAGFEENKKRFTQQAQEQQPSGTSARP